MASNDGLFHQCVTTSAVHVQLRKLLVSDFLKKDDLKERFRLNCRTDLPMSMIQEQSIEKILDFLESMGKFGEGNYGFVKEKVADVHVEITKIIQEAETRIKEIRGDALLVSTYVIDVNPSHLEQETKQKVDLILLAVSEFIVCRSFQPYTNVSALFERYKDLQTISKIFLDIWHGQYCKCGKYFGQKLLLQFTASAAMHFSHGEDQYDYFRNNIFPSFESTLKDCANNIFHVFKDCGAIPVSYAQSSLQGYWVFDSISNLDGLWNKYRNGDLQRALQECFNSDGALWLLNVNKISFRMEILESNYLTYKDKLELKMASNIDSFQTCHSTMDVHNKLRQLLVCEYLPPERESTKFRMLCKSDIPPSDRSSVEDIFNYLERIGKFTEGNYDYVKRKVKDIDVAIIHLIQGAERRIGDIKENRAHGTDVLTTSMEALEIDPVKTTTETTKEDPMGSSVDMLKRKSTVMDPSSDPSITMKIDPVKTAMETTLKDPIKSSVKTSEKKPSVIDTLSDTHITQKKIKFPLSYGSTETAKEDPMGSSVDMPKRKSPLEKVKYSFSSSMKKKLFEINKRLSETPTVLKHMLHSEDEHLYASVSVRQYDGTLDQLLHSRISRMERIENFPDEIFCTSDEYHWKRYKHTYWSYGGSYKHTNTDNSSTCIFLIGEPGCGKTAYCLNLLQKWCQGEALQKFDFVFYVDLSVLQTSTKSVAYLISTSIYGGIYNVSNIDNILRTEKCLVMMDGDNYFNERAHSKMEVYRELLINSSDCVFVFTMRILNLLQDESFYELEYLSRYVPTRVIELFGLDEHGITSLYRKICDIDRLSGSRGKTEESDYQFRIKTEKETKQPEAELDTDVKVCVDVQKKGAGSNTAKSDSEQELTEMTDFDIKCLNFNKIKEMLIKYLWNSYDSIMKIPMLGSVCVRSLVEGKNVPRNLTSLYLCLVDKLVERYDASKETLQRRKEDKSLESHAMFQPYQNIHRHVDTLCKLGKIAYDNAYSPAAIELLNYKKLEGYLGKTEIEFSSETRLIVPVETMSAETCVRFVHKSIQDSLVAMYIVTEKDDVFDSLCQKLTSVDVIINLSHVIMVICGLNHHLGSRITYAIEGTVDKDRHIQRHRCKLSRNTFFYEYYKLQLSWYTEYKTLKSTMEEDTMDTFYVSIDIYVNENADTDTISKTITLMSDKKVVFKSLYVDDVPTESGLSDTVLNGFLAINTSLESICIMGRRTKRSIEPLSFPSLRSLELQNVHIQCTRSDDEASESLLSNLPKLETLELDDIYLNNVLLGLTSDEDRMPLLKYVHIRNVYLGGQSIELAPDMTNIERVQFYRVKMSPQSWMKFVKSLIQIHHDFDVNISDSNIDDESEEMVRSNGNFTVEHDYSHAIIFKRVSTLQ